MPVRIKDLTTTLVAADVDPAADYDVIEDASGNVVARILVGQKVAGAGALMADGSIPLGGTLDASDEDISNVGELEADTVVVSAGLEVQAGGASITGAVAVTGNVSATGTIGGRTMATDGAKLDGIEANADVTDEANVAGAGALMAGGALDIKVAGIEAGANVTNATTVAAAGAVMADGSVPLTADLDAAENGITNLRTATAVAAAATGDETCLELTLDVNKATSGDYSGLVVNVTETAAPGSVEDNVLIAVQRLGLDRFRVFADGSAHLTGALTAAPKAVRTESNHFTVDGFDRDAVIRFTGTLDRNVTFNGGVEGQYGTIIISGTGVLTLVEGLGVTVQVEQGSTLVSEALTIANRNLSLSYIYLTSTIVHVVGALVPA